MDELDPAGRNIFLVSQALRAGTVPPIVDASVSSAHLREHGRAADVEFSGVELLSGASAERDAFLLRWFRERIACAPQFEAQLERIWPLEGNAIAPAALDALARLDEQYQSARLLCLTRSDVRPSGSGRINALLSRHLRESLGGVVDDPDALLAGTPMMMTKNDYQLGLFNGDQGLVLWSQRADDSAPALRLLVRAKGTYVAHELGSLGAQLEPCWAMTVHKAQGSEFNHVALILPTDEEAGVEAEQLACREVVYTAMTRARRSVTVLGSPLALTQAVERSLTRWSALGDPAYWRAD
jgi:exodeoxyribonuclease V alpha subunit